jgi:hypothetical protein
MIHAAAFLFITAMTLPLFAADTRSIIDDVIRMQHAGVADENIIEFVHKTDGRFTVSADDIIALSDAKVPRTVIKAVLDEADERNGVSRDDRNREVVRDRTAVVVAPSVYPYYYDPFYYYGYDPFWWGPRFSVGLRFGGYYGGYHGYHGGGSRGGSHGGHRGHR